MPNLRTATLDLLMQVAQDARGHMECNCSGGTLGNPFGLRACDGNCTHAMAGTAQEMVYADLRRVQPSELLLARLREAAVAFSRIADILDGTFEKNEDSDAEQVYDIATGFQRSSEEAIERAEKEDHA